MARQEREVAMFTAFDDFLTPDPAEPERNLLRAILLSAMSDLKQDGYAKRQATQFFLGEEHEYLFSFQSICSYLEVDPSKVLTIVGKDKLER